MEWETLVQSDFTVTDRLRVDASGNQPGGYLYRTRGLGGGTNTTPVSIAMIFVADAQAADAQGSLPVEAKGKKS